MYFCGVGRTASIYRDVRHREAGDLVVFYLVEWYRVRHRT